METHNTDLPWHPYHVIQPLYDHSTALANLVWRYPTCPPSYQQALQWSICLQAAMVRAYAFAATTSPSTLLTGYRVAQADIPSPFLAYIDDVVTPWSHLDFTSSS